MTVYDYFSKHPNFKPDGSLKSNGKDLLIFCGVPLDETVYEMVKEGRFTDQMPDSSLARLTIAP